MAFDLQALIHEVYRQSKLQRVPPPFVTRLVKLIYLADLEWRRRHGQPLSDLTWRFLHFGPYAYEFVPVLGDPEMEIAEFHDGRTARRFIFDAEALEEPKVPEEVRSIIAQLVRQWGDADINRLLNYVYFDTEPMEHATRGEILDFSTLRHPAREIPPKFDAAKLKALRARLRDRVTKIGLSREGIHIPAIDYDSQIGWEEDGSLSLPIGMEVSQETND